VKEWLGHASMTRTEQYAHLAPDRKTDLVAAWALLHPVARLV
jgi:site-specific recombinase XerD